MFKIFLVGFGGFIGSVFRYWVSGYVQNMMKSIGFPYGTLTVNALGCLVIGILSQLSDTHGLFSSESRNFVFIGMLGGFTTFSTFGNETINLLRGGEDLLAMINILAHLLLGIGAVWAGRIIAHIIWR